MGFWPFFIGGGGTCAMSIYRENAAAPVGGAGATGF